MRGIIILIAGSRGSKLAIIQTNLVIKALNMEVKIKKIKTLGDKLSSIPIAKIEGKGFFTKEIDQALINGDIDFAVHSYKDVPTDLPDELIISSVPKRESPRDALVGKYSTLSELPEKARLGTSSLRRQSQLRKYRPDLNIVDLRGNVDSRIQKLNAGYYDSIVLAEAGLKRIGYKNYYALDPENFIPAACQGALAVISRKIDKSILKKLGTINDEKSALICKAERFFLSKLGGGCQIPAGVYVKSDNSSNLIMFGFIASVDGQKSYYAKKYCSLSQLQETASSMAANLLNQGGNNIIKEIRK